MGFVNEGPYANYENVPYIGEYYSKVFGITTIVNNNIAYLKNIITNKINTIIAYGKSTQDGTPTPEAPVAIESVGELALWTAAGILDEPDQTAGTSTPIDLQGHQLRSLPDGTRDELTVDAQGNVTLTQRVGSYTVTGSETITGGTDLSGWRRGYMHVLQDAPSKKDSEQLGNGRGLCTHAPYLANYTIKTIHTYANISDVYLFAQVSTNADLLAAYTGATILYPLATPQTIDLGNIKLPNFLKYTTVWFATAEMSVSYQQSLANINSEFISHNSFTNFINALAEFLETNIVENWDAANNCYEYAIGADALTAFNNVITNMAEITEIQPIEDLQPIDDIQPISPEVL